MSLEQMKKTLMLEPYKDWKPLRDRAARIQYRAGPTELDLQVAHGGRIVAGWRFATRPIRSKVMKFTPSLSALLATVVLMVPATAVKRRYTRRRLSCLPEPGLSKLHLAEREIVQAFAGKPL